MNILSLFWQFSVIILSLLVVWKLNLVILNLKHLLEQHLVKSGFHQYREAILNLNYLNLNELYSISYEQRLRFPSIISRIKYSSNIIIILDEAFNDILRKSYIIQNGVAISWFKWCLNKWCYRNYFE